MDKFKFDPENGFENSLSYPNPSSATATRKQFQSIPNQIRDFINDTMIPKFDDVDSKLTDGSTKNTDFEKRIASLEKKTGDFVSTDTGAQATKEALFNLLYPVGSIYITSSPRSPADIFGYGTWEQLPEGVMYASTKYQHEERDDNYRSSSYGKEPRNNVYVWRRTGAEYKVSISAGRNIEWIKTAYYTINGVEMPDTVKAGESATICIYPEKGKGFENNFLKGTGGVYATMNGVRASFTQVTVNELRCLQATINNVDNEIVLEAV